ncbi:GGDEF domain-containing protein [Micromonospora maritima]|uniref:GGDEF domain-containing protein n=1 Tax=Micromonospora maritima TaxID=986711 RepID=A0ABW7ZGF6_9ACTN
MTERRRRTLLSAALHAVSHAVAVVYCLMTLAEPHRPLMLGAYGCGLAAGVAGSWVATRVTSKTWSYRVSSTLLLITLVVATVGALGDGGVSSPAALGFVTTAVFVASYTPQLRLMLGFEVLIVGTYLLVAVAGPPAPRGHVFVYVAGMLVLVSVCSTQTRTLARQRSRLRALASLDPLTGALNRRGLAELARFLFRAGCRPGPSLLCLDLDDFKLVNDRLGHAAGDDLLRRVVTATREALRDGDAIARIGGDEFVVVLAAADAEAARSTAARIEATLRPLTSVSVGAATAPHDGDTLDRLLHTADQRLYRVKQQRGRAGARLLADGGGRG